METKELHDLGLRRGAIHNRVVSGRLHPLYTGVYAVGHLGLTRAARELAAVKACGPEALRSHRSAGAARDLIRSSGRPEVTAPRHIKPRNGFVLHRTRNLAAADRTIVDGIPTTSVARTLVDLAEVLNERRLTKAVHQAEIQRLFDLNAIEEVLARVPGRTGRHRLGRVLKAYGSGPRTTRSGGESRFLEICDGHGIPIPHSNVSRAGYELDFLWPDHGLAIELDGPATHYTIYAYHEDRRRDRALAPHHIQVLRVTPLDLQQEQKLADELRRILAAKAA